jgi:hypothetical protein
MKALIAEMKSAKFIWLLERLTGISGLVPDPFDYGGGLHVISRGGFLNVHSDFPFHKQIGLWRRVNILLYLNKDWNPEWGGDLELYPENITSWEDAAALKSSIMPVFNRMVIFKTHDEARGPGGGGSYHGHPSPLLCPEGVTRKSIALYYYTSDIRVPDSIFLKTTDFNFPIKKEEESGY